MNLFKMCLIHRFLPDKFRQSVIAHIINNKNGRYDCHDKYGSIYLVPMFSKA